MLHLPYVPAPYPDEILGSWLARISLHNGRGAWRCLLESVGYGRRIEKPLFDMVDHEEKLEALFNALGTTYARAILELTTLPYWLAFDAASLSKGSLPGTTNTPKLANHRAHENLSLVPVGIGRSAGKSLTIRYCPECLKMDFAKQGEPYWRRTHQLPNVFFCPDHECELQVGCPECKRATVPIAKRLVDLPVLQCPCGHDVRKVTHNGPVPDVYLKLARLSVQSLNFVNPGWDRQQVRAHLRSLLRGATNSSFGQYRAVLAGTFHVTRDSGQRLCTPVPGSMGYRLQLQGHFSTTAAPDCCALLAALNIDFDSASQGFLQAIPSLQEKNLPSVAPESGTITPEFAREEMLRRVAAYPHRPPSSHRRLYWYLRLRDFEWLKGQFPNTIADPIPTVNEDRSLIENILLDVSLPIRKRRETIMNLPSALRALVRDPSWLRERLDELTQESKIYAQKERNDKRIVREAALKDTLQKLLLNEGRPKRISANMLGSMVGLSHLQAAEVIRGSSQLRNALAIANGDKIRRQLLWAIKQLRAEARQLTLTAICARASLPMTTGVNVMVRELIAQINQKGA